MKIDLTTLGAEQKHRLIHHLDSHLQALLAANNELTRRLGPLPGPIADIFNQWCAAINEMNNVSELEIQRICAEASTATHQTHQTKQ